MVMEKVIVIHGRTALKRKKRKKLPDVTSFQFHINRMVVTARFSRRFVVENVFTVRRSFYPCLSYLCTVIENDLVYVFYNLRFVISNCKNVHKVNTNITFILPFSCKL